MENNKVTLLSGSVVAIPFHELFDITNHELVYRHYEVTTIPLNMPDLKRFKLTLQGNNKTVVRVFIHNANLELLVPLSRIISELIEHYDAKVKLHEMKKRVDIDYCSHDSVNVNLKLVIDIILQYNINRIERHLLSSYVPFYRSGCHSYMRINSVKTVDDFINYIISKKI